MIYLMAPVKDPLRILLVSSGLDPAGTAIHRAARELLGREGPGTRLDRSFSHREVADRLIFQDGIDRGSSAGLVIFLSRHASRNPVPILTVHPTGNLFSADLGGVKGSVAPTAPAWMHAVLRELTLRVPEGYRVSYEATHHGPTELSVPSFFVEIGSTAREWSDPAAALAVAGSVVAACPSAGTVPLLGFGGTHYMARQTEIALTTPGAFGHMVPAPDVPRLASREIRLLAERCRAAGAYIDRKSLPPAENARLAGLVEEAGLVPLQTRDLRSLNAIAWKTFLVIRKMAADEGRGVRPVIHARSGSGNPVRIGISPELLSATLSAGTDAFMDGLDRLPVVHLTGTEQAVLPVFIAFGDEAPRVLDALITLCVSIISVREETAFDGDYLVVRKTRFDPGRAQELGVPSGPLFGILMNGGTVTAGNRVITPDLVQRTTERRILIPGWRSSHEIDRRRSTPEG